MEHVPIVIAGVVSLAVIFLVGFIVARLSRKPATVRSIASIITAVAILCGAIPAIVSAFYG
ncbi:hypothetical protein GCM10027294_26390 [Marinactinospora endophytica]